MKLKDSVVVVTGANRGLGQALVEAVLEAGARRVYAAARNPGSIAETARVVPMALDVTNPASIEAAAAKAKDATVLINNAGLLASYALLEATMRDIEQDFAVNTFGLLATTRAFVPALEKAGGAIVNVLSVASLASIPPLAGYSAAKAAAWSMTQAMKVDLGKKGISVHAALPGGIDTDMVRHLDVPKSKPIDVARAILDGVERGDFEIYPEATSQSVAEIWVKDPREAARQLGSM